MSPRRATFDVGSQVRRAAERMSDAQQQYADLHPSPPPVVPAADPDRLALTALRFQPDQQPRDMLPASTWAELIAASQNDPAGCLARLQQLAPDRPASQLVLAHVDELAQSIRSEGILLPLSVVTSAEGTATEHVVLDGHCRAMAAVVAELIDVPIRRETVTAGATDAELTAASHRFLLNWTQQRLTPLEGMREVVRIVGLATAVVLARWGLAPDDDLAGALADGLDGDALGARESGDPDRDVTTGIALANGATSIADEPRGSLGRGQTRAKALEREVRELVLAKTGLPTGRYHTLYRLRRLHPAAQESAEGLSENHLVALLGAPTDLQPLIVQLVKATNASVQETRLHCRMAREHGEEYLLDLYRQALRRKEPARRRTAVSWEPLLRAVPEDLTPRLSALRAELQALPDDRRAVRLRTIARQRELYLETLRVFDEILATYAPTEPDSPAE